MKSIFYTGIFLLSLVTSNVDAQSDWKEDGNTGACAWAKGNQIPIYFQLKTAKPDFQEDAQGKFYWAVEKQGNWIKLRKNTANSFLNGPVLGWTLSSKVEFGSFRNCTSSQ
jgi:hypothetical protein